MRLATSFEDIKKDFGLIIGNFDGVHLGHRKLLSEFVTNCTELGLEAVVLTFTPHPRLYFDPKLENFKICSLDRKRELLFQSSIDYVLEKEFNQSLQKKSAEYFLKNEVFANKGLKLFAVGHDFAMGAGKEDSEKLARKLCEDADVKFTKAKASEFEGEIVSSSRVRKLIKTGDVENANLILERRFQVEGPVVKGQQLGGKKLVPTLNTCYSNEHLLPKNGVYQTLVRIKGIYYESITNVGIRPTVTSSQSRVLETHVFNFHETIYGENIQIEFVSYIRDEKKFNGLEELKEQILKDIDKCKLRFKTTKVLKLALVGKGLSHSLSQQVYEKLLNQSVRYDLLDYKMVEEIPSAKSLLESYTGFSITAPYKKHFLNEVEVKSKFNLAINCVGLGSAPRAVNTDYLACQEILQDYIKCYQILEVFILGDGAMSEVLQTVLKELKVSFHIFSRKQGNLDKLNSLLGQSELKILVINSCSRKFKFGFSTKKDVVAWDLNYKADSFTFFSDKSNVKYFDGTELLEKQAKYALSFWNLDRL